MVEDRLDAVFRALGDRTRRAMLATLSERPQTVGELAGPFDMSLAAASKHVKALEAAGLVKRTVSGRTHTCEIDYAELVRAREWFRHYEQFWNERLDALEAALRADDRKRRKKR